MIEPKTYIHTDRRVDRTDGQNESNKNLAGRQADIENKDSPCRQFYRKESDTFKGILKWALRISGCF